MPTTPRRSPARCVESCSRCTARGRTARFRNHRHSAKNHPSSSSTCLSLVECWSSPRGGKCHLSVSHHVDTLAKRYLSVKKMLHSCLSTPINTTQTYISFAGNTTLLGMVWTGVKEDFQKTLTLHKNANQNCISFAGSMTPEGFEELRGTKILQPYFCSKTP